MRHKEAHGGMAIAGEASQSFGYLHEKPHPDCVLPAGGDTIHRQVVKALDALGAAMIEANTGDNETNSNIPPVYTYLGQFIDHDMTLNTDRNAGPNNTLRREFDIREGEDGALFAPLDRDFIVDNLANGRTGCLDLDSVYGGGLQMSPQLYNGIKFKIGHNTQVPRGNVPPPDPHDLDRDLPRQPDSTLAEISDLRNDENLIIAQLHLAFLRFHNAVIDWVSKHQPKYASDPEAHFKRAYDLVRWHYQWIVVHDFLPKIADPKIVTMTLDRAQKDQLGFSGSFMPLEFSAAAYRFGHSMVRPSYDFNENFGAGSVIRSASFHRLFEFTGGSQNPLGGKPTLPHNWIIDWSRFVHHTSSSIEDGTPPRATRLIDTHLAPPLSDLVNEGNGESVQALQELMKHLARRNLRRGYLLNLPTGECMAEHFGLTPLTPEELFADIELDEMYKEIFHGRTPLWFYILREAERAGGNHLGTLGSYIVATVLIGMIQASPQSFLNQSWNPADGVRTEDGSPIETIEHLLQCAGVL